MRPGIPLVAVLALAGCREKPGEAPPEAPPPMPAFTLRDLAAATALDARLARLSLLAGDVQEALAAGAGPGGGARRPAGPPLSALEAALAEAERADEAISHPADRPRARAAVSAARAYATRVAAAAVDPRGVAPAEVLAARDAFGAAIAAYRGSRAAWRLPAPEPEGAEREFAEARRDLERAETALGSGPRLAPREEGRALDPAVRTSGKRAAERAKAAASRLAPTLAGPAARWAAAEERAFLAVTALGEAPAGERAAIARRYQAAKAEALAALADYFAALASR